MEGEREPMIKHALRCRRGYDLERERAQRPRGQGYWPRGFNVDEDDLFSSFYRGNGRRRW